MPRRRRPEDEIQRAVFQHIGARGVQGLVAFHCPNGGARSPVEASILVGLGVKAGIADVLALYRSNFFALELKAPGRRSTKAQRDFRDAVNAAGGIAAEAVGLDAALQTLEGWGLLKGRVQ